jgi:hypothetical protein
MADHQEAPSLFCVRSRQIKETESINEGKGNDVENVGLIMAELFSGKI